MERIISAFSGYRIMYHDLQAIFFHRDLWWNNLCGTEDPIIVLLNITWLSLTFLLCDILFCAVGIWVGKGTQYHLLVITGKMCRVLS